MLTFIDDATQYTTVYFLQYKSNTFKKFVEFKLFIETQTRRKLKILHSNGGGEYINNEMQKYLKEYPYKRNFIGIDQGF